MRNWSEVVTKRREGRPLNAVLLHNPIRAAFMHIRSLSFISLLLLAPQPTAGAQAALAGAQTGDIALAPGDIIRISVWREPDLSGEFLVDEFGVVTLPLLGKMSVLDVPLSRLRDKLITRYTVELRNPSITVTPLRRVYVLGEVTKPGPYAVDPTISLAGVVALAGGATPTGDLGHLRVVRNGTVIRGRVSATSSLSLINILSGDQVFVERRGWLDRNGAVAASAALSAATLAITLLLRR